MLVWVYRKNLIRKILFSSEKAIILKEKVRFYEKNGYMQKNIMKKSHVSGSGRQIILQVPMGPRCSDMGSGRNDMEPGCSAPSGGFQLQKKILASKQYIYYFGNID